MDKKLVRAFIQECIDVQDYEAKFKANHIEMTEWFKYSGEVEEEKPVYQFESQRSSKYIYDYKEKADVFGIDEAQFFDDELIKISNKLAKTGKRVVIAGLDKDYTAKSFGPIHQLMIDAEYVSKVNAICMQCGDPASFTQRISSEKNLVVVGEADKYEARCRNCFKP